MNYSEQFVEVHRKRTQILRGGSGPPLLYLHSAGGEVAWLPFFEQLAERFDVIVPAHPGFAESEGLDQIDSMEDLVFHYIDPHVFHRGTVGTKEVGHDDSWHAVALHCTLEERQRSSAIPALRGKDFEHLTFVIHGAPEVVRFTVDTHEHLVQMPAPVRV